MPNRLFRYAELVAPKYGFRSVAIDKEPSPPSSEIKKNIERAKSDLINAYNLYVNPENVPVKNKYSAISGIAHTNKHQVFRELALLHNKNAKEVLTTLHELFPDGSGDLDRFSLTIIVNRLNKVLSKLSDEAIEEMIKFYQSIYTRETDRIAKVKNLKATVKSLKGNLLSVAKTLSPLAGKEAPEAGRYVPTPGTINKQQLRMFVMSTDQDTLEYLGLTDEDALELALSNELRDLVQHVIWSVKRGDNRPPAGAILRKKIETLKKSRKEQTLTNEPELEAGGIPPYQPNPASLFEPKTGPKADIPFTVSRPSSTFEEEEEYKRQKREREAKEQGGGAGEGSL